MTKKKPFGTHQTRGRKGVYLGTNKSDAHGKAFINVSFSLPARTTKAGKKVKGSIIEKRGHWVEITGSGKQNAAMLNQALRRRSTVISHIISTRNTHNKIVEAFGKIGRGDLRGTNSSIPQAWIREFRGISRFGIKPALQKMLGMVGSDESSKYLRKERGANGKMMYNLGLTRESRKQWERDTHDNRKELFGIRNFDIRRAVKAYGRGIIPDKDVKVFAKDSNGNLKVGKDGKPILLRTIKSVASSGVWWRDVKHVGANGKVTWERKLDKELESRLLTKMAQRAEYKYQKRHKADPLMGTRKRGRKALEKSAWMPSWLKGHVAQEWAKNEAQKANTFAQMFGRTSSHHAWVRPTIPEGVNMKLRRIRSKIVRQLEEATISAQDQLMRELEYVRSWHNLTGNAYTGIVSAAYVSSDRISYRRETKQMPGVRGRKATRGKISAGKYNRYYKTSGGKRSALKEKGAKVYIGRRFDAQNEYFYIKERGQFVSTNGSIAYQEAMKLINQFNPRMNGNDVNPQRLKGLVASLKVVSGTPEYIDKLPTAHGGSIMAYAIQRATEILQQKAKNIQI